MKEWESVCGLNPTYNSDSRKRRPAQLLHVGDDAVAIVEVVYTLSLDHVQGFDFASPAETLRR